MLQPSASVCQFLASQLLIVSLFPIVWLTAAASSGCLRLSLKPLSPLSKPLVQQLRHHAPGLAAVKMEFGLLKEDVIKVSEIETIEA